MRWAKSGNWRRLARLSASFLAAALSTAAGADWAAPQREASFLTPVILVSVDTLRADRLACYGNLHLGTPHLDALTQGGTLFFQIDAQVPMTLPSHASLLTSTYPFVNGVEENGGQLGPDAVTLATVLRARGYRTAAFLGAYVLNRQFGLDQGFEIYDSPFGVHSQAGSPEASVRRPAQDVISAAMRWLDENSSRPFFLFLHLYDLHLPYMLPSAQDAGGRGGYELELKHVDDVLGQFWDYLVRQGLFAKTLIVLTSDHGESLGEHGEETHQYFIYQSTLWVPLILHWPLGAGPYPAKVDKPGMLLDVAPTVLQFLGIPHPSQFQGRSLLVSSSSEGGPTSPGVYSESLYARDHFGCSALRSLRAGRYKYIDAPQREFYDLESDPHELRNLYPQENSLALSLRQQLLDLRAGMTTTRQTPSMEPSQETIALLNSLGYTELTYPRGGADDSGCDPKARLAEYRQYGRAIAAAQVGNDREAIQDFRQVIASDQQNALAHYYLAASYFHVRAWDDAVRELQQTLRLSPKDTRSHELLGTIWLEKGEYQRAQTEYEELLKLAPHSYGGNYNLGQLAVRQGQIVEGIRYLRGAVEADPKSPGAYNALGIAYFRAGDARQAQAEFEQAIRLEPKNAAAHYNLGLALRQQNDNAAAAQEFQKALEDDPTDPRARKALDELRKASVRIQ